MTREPLAEIRPEGAKDVFALLDAYRGYYSRGALHRAVPVLDAIDRELSRRHTLPRTRAHVLALFLAIRPSGGGKDACQRQSFRHGASRSHR